MIKRGVEVEACCWCRQWWAVECGCRDGGCSDDSGCDIGEGKVAGKKDSSSPQ